jgi:hypothetical protein
MNVQTEKIALVKLLLETYDEGILLQIKKRFRKQ